MVVSSNGLEMTRMTHFMASPLANMHTPKEETDPPVTIFSFRMERKAISQTGRHPVCGNESKKKKIMDMYLELHINYSKKTFYKVNFITYKVPTQNPQLTLGIYVPDLVNKGKDCVTYNWVTYNHLERYDHPISISSSEEQQVLSHLLNTRYCYRMYCTCQVGGPFIWGIIH